MILTKQREAIEQRFYDYCLGAIEKSGLALYDLEYIDKQKMLRVFIMNQETNSAVIDDCVLVTKKLQEVFDELSWVPEDLVVEVSSPGLNRPLKTREQFERVLGDFIKVKLNRKLKDICEELNGVPLGEQKKMVGKLDAIQEEGLLLGLAKSEERYTIPYKHIIKANWEPLI